MRILWITNVLFPKVSNYLGYSKTIIGGWTYSAADELRKRDYVQLAVASLYMGNKFQELNIDNELYYLIPCNGNMLRYNNNYECDCKKIEQSFHPDVVHIYGTEYPITLAYLNACGNKRVVVSLQGLPSIYSRYFFSGIGLMEIIKRPILFFEKISFDRNNRNEIKALKQIQYYEGRSNWDHAISWASNHFSRYYHCNRTLRNVFYEDKWNIEKIEHHSIFLSQAQYSIKGLHQVLKALPIVLSVFPDTKVYIAGDAPFNNSTIKNMIKSLGYGNYIRTLIKYNGLKDSLVFLGPMSADEMKLRYLSANVFVCPSSIENVPNSLAEAQILGVPCIASYVGGNSSLIDEGFNGLLYRFEDFEILAKYICDIFSNQALSIEISINGRKTALERHNKDRNIDTLVSIYQDVIDNISTK